MLSGCAQITIISPPTTPQPSQSTSLEIELSASPSNLSIAQGSQESVFIDMSGVNAKSFTLSMLIFQIEDPETLSNIAVKLKTPQEALRCIGEMVSSLTCINDGPIESFDFENLEVELSVPETEEAGTWDVFFRAAAWDTDIPNENSKSVMSSFTDKLTITENN